VEFENFWSEWPKKVAKKKAELAWKKLTPLEKREALEALPQHIKYWQIKKTEMDFIPYPASWLNGNRWEDCLDLTPAKEKKRQRGRRMKEHNEPAFTLTAQDRHGLMVGSKLRRFTPLECERLQSLPDDWTRWYADGSEVPDTHRYERCGRAVTVNVIYEIAKKLPA
jgi:site-specific DNA-cytosine methylase